MKKYKKIAIAIDNSKVDEILYKACINLNSLLLNVEDIHLLFARNLDVLQKQQIKENAEFMELDSAHEIALKDAITAKANTILGETFKGKLHIHVFTGSPIEEVLKFQEEQPIDLFIVGKKASKKRSGRFAKELIRRGEIPLLIIPQKINLKRNLWDILVPYDFSKLSDTALLTAMELKPYKQGYKVECFHMMDAPILTSEMIVASHSLYQKMIEGRKEAFEDKAKELKLTSVPDFNIHESYNNNISKEIIRRGLKGKFGLIIMGAKGHSAFERFFLGSVTEKTITRNDKLPLLIVT